MQNEPQTKVSRLLERVEQAAQQGKREKAYQLSLEATGLTPDDPMAWYLRSRVAPSREEQLMCLSRVYSLDITHPEARQELRPALQELLKQEPFLAYVYETQQLYQVRSGRDLLINIPKNRAFEIPYLQRNRSTIAPAFRWLYLSMIGLVLGGVGAALLAPITIFQVLRLQTLSLLRSDRIRLWVVFILAVLIWLLSIPISWLLLIRFFQS
jgi:hypothetical protein